MQLMLVFPLYGIMVLVRITTSILFTQTFCNYNYMFISYNEVAITA
jgi:hypothetical protein